MKRKSLINKLKSSKLSLLLTGIIATVIDLVVSILLFQFGYDLKYVVCPLILVAINVLFLGYTFLANFRFRYTIPIVVMYCIALVLTTGVSFFIYHASSSEVIMTTLMVLLWLVAHALVVVMTICSSCIAKNKMNTNIIKSTIISFGLILVMVVYFSFLFANGFFGQGFENKTLVYSENEDGTYSVVDVLKDNNDTIVINETFNGKSVTSFSATLLERNDIKKIIFETYDNEFSIIDDRYKMDINDKISIEANRDTLFNVKKAFYNTDRESLINAANKILPNDIKEDEVYVNFTYDQNALDFLDGEIFETWISDKGDEFEFPNQDEFQWLEYVDDTSDSDLYWNYYNNDKYIFTSINLIDQKVYSNIENYEIKFDKIYKVVVNRDNDTYYEANDEYKNTILPSGALDYKLTTIKNAQSIIDNFPEREGFEIVWEDSLENQINNLSYELEKHNSTTDEYEIYPKWSMKAPVIEELASNALNNTITYGDAIKLSSTVEAASVDFELTYKWYKNNILLKSSTDNFIDLNDLLPNDSGDYKLIVSSSSRYSSIKSSATLDVTVKVNKRPLDITWVLPTDNVYDAANKYVYVEYETNQVVGNDIISYSLSSNEEDVGRRIQIKNAGEYSFLIELNDDTSEKYTLTDNDVEQRYMILPREISVIVDDASLEFTYDGEIHAPVIEDLDNVVSSEAVSILNQIVANAGKQNAGEYTHRFNLSNSNYSVLNPTIEYVINPRPITLSWSSVRTFTYNNEIQHPTYTFVSGYITADRDDVLNSIEIEGGEVNYSPDSYICEAVISNSNYVISNNTCEFNIEKLVVNATASNVTSIYGDDIDYLPYTIADTDIVYSASHWNGALEIDGEIDSETGAYNVGDYDILLGTLALTDNYELIFTGGTLSVTPKEIVIDWCENDFTYTGDDQKNLITASYKDINNNNIDLAVTMPEFINFGDYEAVASFKNSEVNYTLPSVITNMYNIKQATNEWVVDYNRADWIYGDVPSTPIDAVVVFGTLNVKYYSDAEHLIEVTDFSEHTEAATYYVNITVEETENYTGLIFETDFKVNKREIEIVWLEEEFIFNNEIQEITAHFMDIDGNKIDLTVSTDEEFKNSGNYVATAEFNEEQKNYKLPANVNMDYEIAMANNSWVTEFSRQGWTYGATPTSVEINPISRFGEPNIEYYKDENCTSKVTSFSYSTNAGTYYAKVMVPQTSNYYAIQEVYSFEISKMQISTINWSENDYVYNGTIQSIKATFTDIFNEDVSLNVSIDNNLIFKNVGEYKAIASLKTSNSNNYEIACLNEVNYNIKVGQAYWVNEYDITGWVYGDDPINKYPTYSFVENSTTFNGFASIEYYSDNMCENKVNITNKTTIGTYYVKAYVSDTINYYGVERIYSINITPRELTVTIEDKTSAYGDALAELTYDITSGNTVNSDDLGIVLTKEEGLTVGDYSITGTAANTNYAVTFVDAAYTIIPRELTITIEDKESVYGESLEELTYIMTSGNIVNSDDLGVVLEKEEGLTVGYYSITGTAANTNYAVTFVDAAYTIIPRELTITIEDKESAYGESLEELTYSVTSGNIVNSDDLGVVLTKEEGLTVGAYSITGTAANTNYDVIFVDGIYEITPRELTITIENKTSIYGESLEELTYSVTSGNIVNSDDLGVMLTKEEGLAVGEYSITGTAANTNYDVTFVDGTYKITQATTVVTDLKLDGWNYGDTANEPTATSNFGVVIYLYSSSLEGEFTETKPSEVGQYYVKAVVYGTENYSSCESEAVLFEIMEGAEF